MAFFKELNKFIKLTFRRGSFITPPILIFFVTSRCNAKCSHCFYSKELNRKNDLMLSQIDKPISHSMGKIYKLILSGGEPFLREDLAELCELFYRNNQSEEIQIPTNGLAVEKIVSTISEICRRCSRARIYLNISLDGTEDVHDRIRGVPGTYGAVMKLYQRLATIKPHFPNLNLVIVSTITKGNIDNLFELFAFIKQKMPLVDRYSLGIERGRYYTEAISYPPLPKIEKLTRLANSLNRESEKGMRQRLIDKIDQNKLRVIREKRQVVPCQAGRLVGVVYENGNVANCEMLPAVGNVKDSSFKDVWLGRSKRHQEAEIIRKKRCYCTHECFISPSTVYRIL